MFNRISGMRSQRCRKERGSRLVGSIQTHREGKASFCPLWTRTLYYPPRWICRACTFLSSWCPLAFSLSRDGANALNCFTRDCETRETGLEGALRCSGAGWERRGGWLLYGSWTRGYTRPKKCVPPSSPLSLHCSPRCLFQSLSPSVKYFWAEMAHVSPFPPVKLRFL